MSVEDYIVLYKQVAKQAFELHLLLYLAILISLFTNRIYPARNLDAALQEVFGDKTILDCLSAITIGIKIEIVASIIKLQLFLFTNYNGLGDKEDKKFKKYGVLLGDALV